MIAKYITQLKIMIDPFNTSASKTGRRLVSLINTEKARQQGLNSVQVHFIPASQRGKERSTAMITFKDYTVLNLETDGVSIKDMVTIINRHSRKLAIKDL